MQYIGYILSGQTQHCVKPLYTIVLLLLSAFITTAQEKGDMIIEDRLLTWDDFQGKHKSETFDAMTNYIIIMEPNKYMSGTLCQTTRWWPTSSRESLLWTENL